MEGRTPITDQVIDKLEIILIDIRNEIITLLRRGNDKQREVIDGLYASIVVNFRQVSDYSE